MRRRDQRDVTAPSAMTVRDLIGESLAGLFARPGRTALTVLGTVIGLAALVATMGLSRTAGNRIVGRFDALAATEITIAPKPSASSVTDPNHAPLPWDGPERIGRLNGVAAVGSLATVDVGQRLVSASPIRDPQRPSAFRLTIKAASPGAFRAVQARLRTGTLIDAGHSSRRDRVAVIGPNAATRLAIDRLDGLPSVRIGDDVYLVIGILDRVARQPDLQSAVIIPEGAARHDYRLTSPDLVVVETDIGAAPLVAQQVALALRPDNPRSLKVLAPPEPRRVRDAVRGDLDLLFLTLGGVSLLVGAVGIANVTLVSVMERTGEIGLRRAMGASRRHICGQFLVESTTIGFVGGVVGASLGTLAVVAVSIAQSWTPVLDSFVPLAAPVLGAVTGLLSGTYPALRAANLTPVDALRSGA